MTAAQTMSNVTSLSQALTMSLTSTSSESDNDFLETCRATTLLAELEDDDELPEPEDEDDENEDENEEDDEYDDVMVGLDNSVCTKFLLDFGVCRNKNSNRKLYNF